jgi:predicted transcriptional regulator
MDMTTIYRSATQEALQNAIICLDQFHAMKWVNEALDLIYRATPSAGLGIEAGARGWSKARTALRYGVEHLNTEQRKFVNSLRRRRYGLFCAWELKEAYRDLYKIVDPTNARAYLTAWCTQALKSRLKPFITLVKRIRRHFDGLTVSLDRSEGARGNRHACDSVMRMTTQLAIRLDDDDLNALDELARANGITRSEAARMAIRAQAMDTSAAKNRAELDRVGALLGIAPGARWVTADEILRHRGDDAFAADIAAALGDGSNDDIGDPWSR